MVFVVTAPVADNGINVSPNRCESQKTSTPQNCTQSVMARKSVAYEAWLQAANVERRAVYFCAGHSPLLPNSFR
jgi:hypothetical protein